MRIALRKIGNSKGIIIPSPFLSACKLGDEVDIQIQGKTLVIQPVKTLRENWFPPTFSSKNDMNTLLTIPIEEDDREWAW